MEKDARTGSPETWMMLAKAISAGVSKAGSNDTDYLLVDLGRSAVEDFIATLARLEVSKLLITEMVCEELKGGEMSAAHLVNTVKESVILNAYVAGAVGEKLTAGLLCSMARAGCESPEGALEFIRQRKADFEAVIKSGIPATPPAEERNKDGELVWSLHEIEAYLRRAKK